MQISIIVAIAENNAIGKNNTLLWHLSGDLKRFKEITSGHCVIMGRNTYLSLPNRPLKNRRNIVISHLPEDDKLNFIGAEVVENIEHAISIANQKEENFVIGGSMVYKYFLPLADKLYLTKIKRTYDADAFFPEINFSEWELISEEEHTENEPPYCYLVYIRKQPYKKYQ